MLFRSEDDYSDQPYNAHAQIESSCTREEPGWRSRSPSRSSFCAQVALDGGSSHWFYEGQIEVVEGSPPPPPSRRPTVGERVNVVRGEYIRQQGRLVKDDHDAQPFKVRAGNLRGGNCGSRSPCVRMTRPASRNRSADPQETPRVLRWRSAAAARTGSTRTRSRSPRAPRRQPLVRVGLELASASGG